MGAGHSTRVELNQATKGPYTYGVGYAQTGTAKCRETKKTIAKGALRVTRSSPNPFYSEGHASLLTQYFLPQHAFVAFLRSNCGTRVPMMKRDLVGYASLTPADKRLVSAELRKFTAALARTKHCSKK